MRTKKLKRFGCMALSMAMAASLAGCSGGNGGAGDAAANQPSSTVVVTADGEEKVQINDFYLYANEDWMNANQLDADEIAVNRDDESIYRMYERLDEIFKESKPEDFSEDDPMYKMSALYYQCEDAEQHNVAAMARIKELTDHVLGIKNVSQLQAVMEDSDYATFNNICNLYYVESTGLMFFPAFRPVPMYELYRDITPEQTEIMKAGIAKEFVVLGYSEEEAAKIAENGCAFDQVVRDFYNNYTDELWTCGADGWAEIDCSIDLLGILQAEHCVLVDRFGDEDYYFFKSDGYVEWLNTNITDANIEMIRDFYACTIVEKLHYYGSADLVIAGTSVIGEICGAAEISAEEAGRYDAIYQTLMYDEGAVAAYYTSKYVTDEIKEEVVAITKGIVGGYKTFFDTVDWLNAVQIERMKNKAGLITYHWGSYNDYNHLEDMVVADNLVDTIISQRNSNRKYAQRMLVEHFDDKENVYTDTSGISLYQNNAFYDPESNSIVICLGYFADDYLWNDASYEEKMAMIGTTIAHEIGHAYDASHIAFKKTYEYDDRWEEYADYYRQSVDNTYTYYQDMKTDFGASINGYVVLNEGMSDIIGMKATITTLEKKENIDYDQFFTAYARKYGRVAKEEYSSFVFSQDGHVPNHERINSVLALCDKFYEVYEVNEKSPYYVKPADRFCIFDYEK